MSASPRYDSLLLLSFGAPEAQEEVMPFLERVVSGRRVPRERLLAVAEHYAAFGGRSPLADQNRALIDALRAQFEASSLDLPIYWGNLHWHPLLTDTVREMKGDGCRRALVLVTSAYGGGSACRKYCDAIAQARATVGEGAPELHKLRHYFNHPGFIGAMCERIRPALEEASDGATLLFTAHSVPTQAAGVGKYVGQLEEVSRVVASELGWSNFRLVYQSRSGPPHIPWLEPDVIDALDEEAASGRREVIVAPIGFTSDHMEVVYDLDTEAAAHAKALGIRFWRAGTVGVHPRFVAGLLDLVRERLEDDRPRLAVGRMPASPDICPADCCQRSGGHEPPRARS